jgi:class 3 adenylate cyclase
VRKTVSIVRCDVTGSTALGERLDAEVLRGVMSRYFDEMRTVIERYGGTVEKFIGDAVMAVFGIRSCMRTTLCAQCTPRTRCASPSGS